MVKTVINGVWPTMITLFRSNNIIDYSSLEKLVEWYIGKKVKGLFAVCQSSEMFFLSLEERIKLAKAVIKYAGGRIPVIASGHISDSFEDQAKEVNMMAETGVDAVVLVTNRFASRDESDDVWKRNLEKFLSMINESILLGFYECPFPYKRLLKPSILRWCIETKRFGFLKDTSCDLDQIKAKWEILKNSGLKIFNANSATFLESLRVGVSGYSGVMANFHPEFYVWMCNNWQKEPEKAEKLQNFLGLSSVIEHQAYPVNAKYYLKLEGLPISLHTRCTHTDSLSKSQQLEVKQLWRFSQIVSENFEDFSIG